MFQRAGNRDHHRAGADLARAPIEAWAGDREVREGESMSLLVVGSVALDTLETPSGRVDDAVGGAATYFAYAASFFTPVRMVAAIGEDFPEEVLADLQGRGVDVSGVERRAGSTLRWSGRYHEELNVRDTLHLDLGVFADFLPNIPESYRDADYAFLANIDPALQSRVLDQLQGPKLVGCDTMNHWIQESRPTLDALLKRVDMLVVNDEEAELLTDERNVVRAAGKILDAGPQRVLIKRGEYGVIEFSGDTVFAVPAYPLEEVRDPTGAGDCFAAGVMGELARSGDLSAEGLRRAIVYGSVMGSFVVEDFGPRRLLQLTAEMIEERYQLFVSLTDIPR
jgi:sugar/nucleoside kinase (ribokinase family)